jgi:hypothetical protein
MTSDMENMMKRFLIKHEAVIGRTQEDGADHAPLELIYYSMVEASTLDQATDMAMGYADKTFKVKVTDIVEVGDTISSNDLYVLLKQETILKAMY